MNRKQRRLSSRVGAQKQKQKWDEFKQINYEAKLRGLDQSLFDDVFQNNKYIVFVLHNEKRKGRVYTRVMCRRSDGKPIYSWQDLFRIKNEIFGEDVEAVQFLPPKSELIDTANLYWFWIERGELDG